MVKPAMARHFTFLTSRLKHTFHGSRVETIKDLEDLFNPMSAFKNLREHLQNEELNNLPVIPYIGM